MAYISNQNQSYQVVQLIMISQGYQRIVISCVVVHNDQLQLVQMISSIATKAVFVWASLQLMATRIRVGHPNALILEQRSTEALHGEVGPQRSKKSGHNLASPESRAACAGTSAFVLCGFNSVKHLRFTVETSCVCLVTIQHSVPAQPFIFH
jgi:hypothetical protein